ncbi:ESX secretion-associated protein EspG [Nocardia caishijiensis]|uniref:ESAT-6 protein secretion system EspG family protein n=1 Tax=Nocardia caishijiensis TaxID=184756 RepID=A0ABQ6YRT6_9NOCA|nr:ESX secretion-associated protein EspG [Nocardia caishijiensis]KAF0848285.1 ESAT-6 protein secretion system EspG family protein [Nocardia caishijiensis]
MTTLTTDGLLTLTERLGVQTLPTVLAVWPQWETYDELRQAQAKTLAALESAGSVDDFGEVSPELSDSLVALANPERELVVRVYGGGEIVRMSLVRRGEQHAFAVRRGEHFEITSMWNDGSGAALARPILEALGRCEAAQVVSFSAPAAEIAERLDGATESSDYADAVYALGVQSRDATAYGLAFGSCRSFAEIVAYAHEDGVTTSSPGAVVVYDTAHGRIAAAPGSAPDQRVWSTVTSGTDHRIAQAISGLVDSLPGGSWLPTW